MKRKAKDGIYNRFVKRILDIICALLALVVFSWLYIITAILVRVKLGSPVIFKQPRPGKKGKDGREKIFTLCKFRSMNDERDENGELLPDDIRLTNFGRKLRATSLDELPEAWNILKGEMSVVGPRPLRVSYLPYYTDAEIHRHDVRPGLTGLAQVQGRNDLSWEEKFEFDIEYVEKVSFVYDVKIVFATIKKVLFREGIGQGVECPVSLYEVRDRNPNYKD